MSERNSPRPKSGRSTLGVKTEAVKRGIGQETKVRFYRSDDPSHPFNNKTVTVAYVDGESVSLRIEDGSTFPGDITECTPVAIVAATEPVAVA